MKKKLVLIFCLFMLPSAYADTIQMYDNFGTPNGHLNKSSDGYNIYDKNWNNTGRVRTFSDDRSVLYDNAGNNPESQYK